ncbi:MAG: TIM barrel protein [Bacteroidales bacterium]|nr:TIM barrel protein [Bacteroidales bacterium]
MLAAAIVFTAAACEPKQEAPQIPIGVQLYSVRWDLENDFYGTLKAVKELGYDGVEFAGLYGNTPEQVKQWCEEIGLTPISAHVPLADMLADIDQVISDYKTIGCEYIAVPYVTEERRPDGELFLQMVDEIAAIALKVSDAGMTLLYHNHDFEFKKYEDQYGLDYLYGNIDADLLQTELDLCWVKYAGEDPAQYLLKYADRSPVVHFKDYYFEAAEGEQGDPYALIGIDKKDERPSTFEFRPMGCGLQDVPALLEAYRQAGSKWIIVEQDQPSMDFTPMECIGISVKHLKHLISCEGCPCCHECDSSGKCDKCKHECDSCDKCKHECDSCDKCQKDGCDKCDNSKKACEEGGCSESDCAGCSDCAK